MIEFLGTLNQPYTTRMDGRYRSRSRWKREIYSGARERVYLWVSSHCSCDAQIQAANLLRTAIYPS